MIATLLYSGYYYSDFVKLFRLKNTLRLNGFTTQNSTINFSELMTKVIIVSLTITRKILKTLLKVFREKLLP